MPGDVIGVFPQSVGGWLVRLMQDAAVPAKPWWARSVSHVAIARDEQTVIDAMPGRIAGGVAPAALFPDTVSLGARFVVLRLGDGSAGASVVAAAQGFLGRPYSLSQAAKQHLADRLPSQVWDIIQRERDADRELRGGVVCSSLVLRAFKAALSSASPFDGVSLPFGLPMPVDIVTCPGFTPVEPNWA